MKLALVKDTVMAVIGRRCEAEGQVMNKKPDCNLSSGGESEMEIILLSCHWFELLKLNLSEAMELLFNWGQGLNEETSDDSLLWRTKVIF